MTMGWAHAGAAARAKPAPVELLGAAPARCGRMDPTASGPLALGCAAKEDCGGCGCCWCCCGGCLGAALAEPPLKMVWPEKGKWTRGACMGVPERQADPGMCRLPAAGLTCWLRRPARPREGRV